LKSDRPTERDFLSHAQLGKIPPLQSADFLRRWEGLSVFTTYEAAWENAANLRWRIGEYVAEVVVPDDIDYQCDGPDERRHCNLYGLSAADLLRWVTRVIHGRSIPPPSRN
jgi:hypothetical protein